MRLSKESTKQQIQTKRAEGRVQVGGGQKRLKARMWAPRCPAFRVALLVPELRRVPPGSWQRAPGLRVKLTIQATAVPPPWPISMRSDGDLNCLSTKDTNHAFAACTPNERKLCMHSDRLGVTVAQSPWERRRISLAIRRLHMSISEILFGL